MVVCQRISKLSNIDSWVRWRKAVLLLVLLAGVASSLASTSEGAVVYNSLISWLCIYMTAIHGERRGSVALGTRSSAVWSVGPFGDRCGRGTLGLSIPVSTPLCEVLKGVGGDRSSNVDTLGGSLMDTLGGGAVLRRGRGLMGYATLNFSGSNRVRVQEGESFLWWVYVVPDPRRLFCLQRYGQIVFVGWRGP